MRGSKAIIKLRSDDILILDWNCWVYLSFPMCYYNLCWDTIFESCPSETQEKHVFIIIFFFKMTFYTLKHEYIQVSAKSNRKVFMTYQNIVSKSLQLLVRIIRTPCQKFFPLWSLLSIRCFLLWSWTKI